ncbi:S-layer homology domain-containing protein [Paenibacillus foliorum]|nr:S-layer homology domain-containing protein [Paenibacillus foliorum]
MIPKLMTAIILLAALSQIDEPRVAAVENKSFPDLPESHWSYKAVQEMSGKQIVDGYPDGTFRPNQTLTRAEFAALLYKTARLEEAKASSKASSYQDVDLSAWYKPYADALRGIFVQNELKGVEELFNPDAPALREDVAAAIVRLRGWSGGSSSDLRARFKDVNTISEGATQELATAVDRGIISGYEDGTIRGKAALTRAEAAMLLTKSFSEGPSSVADQVSVKQTEVESQTSVIPIKAKPVNQKPLYAIVDMLARDDGVNTYTSSKLDFTLSNGIHSQNKITKHLITDLSVDYKGDIYFVETKVDLNTPSTVKRLDEESHLPVTELFIDDSLFSSLSGPIFEKMKENRVLTKNHFLPVKLLSSVNNVDKQFIGNWPDTKFWSLFTFLGRKVHMASTKIGTMMKSEDFIIQLPNGDYIFSDITNGTIQRIKPGDGDNEELVSTSFSGRPLAALIEGEQLYILDPGLKSIVKVDIHSRKVVEKVVIQIENITYAVAKDNQFYISSEKNLFSVDVSGRIDPFLEERQFVYNDLISGNQTVGTKNQMDIVQISEFAFEPTGNIVFIDDMTGSFIRRLRLVKEQPNQSKSLPIIQTGAKLAKIQMEKIAHGVGIQVDQKENMISSIMMNEEGNLYLLEKNKSFSTIIDPLILKKSSFLKLWNQGSSRWNDLDNRYYGMRFEYYDAEQKLLKPKDYWYTGGLYFDGRNNAMHRAAWSQELNIATVNRIYPESITVGYMAGRGAVTEQDFVAFDGTGQIVVSDVSQGDLWFIGRDRQGYKLSPSEVGKHIRYSGKSTAAIWKDQNLYVLDAGNKTVTELKLNVPQYIAQAVDVKIDGVIDAVNVYGDKFYVMSGSKLYRIETDGSISSSEDLTEYLIEKTPVSKISIDSNGRLMLLDQKGNLLRIHF